MVRGKGVVPGLMQNACAVNQREELLNEKNFNVQKFWFIGGDVRKADRVISCRLVCTDQ